MIDLVIVAEALDAGQHGNAKEGTIDYAILGRLAQHFRTQAKEQCNCGACPGWSVGTEWDWLIQ